MHLHNYNGEFTSKIKHKRGIKNNWKYQGGDFTTLEKVKTEFYLLELITTKNTTPRFQVEKFTESRYTMVLGRDILTQLGIDNESSKLTQIMDEDHKRVHNTYG